MVFRLVPLIGGPAPIAVTGPGPNGELYLADQNGVIMTYLSGTTTIFLDLRSQIPPLNPDYDERGLLDIAMSPRRDRLFAFYTSLSGHNVLVEIDLRTRVETILLRILDQADFHNGGRMAFGPDGYLYLTVGDPRGNAQNLSSLLGKVLRLDVSRPGKYQIPADNPFVGYPGLRPEIYAYGFRNPSGISFNRHGIGYVTDPGTDRFEEVDILVRGGNYGWAIKEGTNFTGYSGGTTGGTHLPGTPADTNQPFVDPIYEYPTGNPGGISISPSAILGGASLPDDTYIFADYGGAILALSRDNRLIEAQKVNSYVRAISQDLNGTIYIMTSDSPGPNGQGQISRVEQV